MLCEFAEQRGYRMLHRRKLLVALTATVLAGVPCYFVWLLYYTHLILKPEAYAVWQTADLIIAYMEQHTGAWPRGWEDLRPSRVPRKDGPHIAKRDGTFEVGLMPSVDINRLQQLVEVDWSANVEELKRADWRGGSPPFRVIWLRSGRRTAFQGCEPNQLIKGYLDGRYQLQLQGPSEPQ